RTVRLDLMSTPDTTSQLPPDAPPVNIDPNGPSIFIAIQEQLGLKLETTRGPVDVVVIDSVGRPVPDLRGRCETSLIGRFAFRLACTPDPRNADRDADAGIPRIDPNAPSIFTASQEKLRLKLEPANSA